MTELMKNIDKILLQHCCCSGISVDGYFMTHSCYQKTGFHKKHKKTGCCTEQRDETGYSLQIQCYMVDRIEKNNFYHKIVTAAGSVPVYLMMLSGFVHRCQIRCLFVH